MGWYWVVAAFAISSGAFYMAYEAEKKVKMLEEKVKKLEGKNN